MTTPLDHAIKAAASASADVKMLRPGGRDEVMRLALEAACWPELYAYLERRTDPRNNLFGHTEARRLLAEIRSRVGIGREPAAGRSAVKDEVRCVQQAQEGL